MRTNLFQPLRYMFVQYELKWVECDDDTRFPARDEAGSWSKPCYYFILISIEDSHDVSRVSFSQRRD